MGAGKTFLKKSFPRPSQKTLPRQQNLWFISGSDKFLSV